ncbi:MAG TPA: divalent-cation tolerance protein CutA [Planctomycetota bacterium]|nr:divalent-cation tolerance protein CutA [Planctomycetota bacterium]
MKPDVVLVLCTAPATAVEGHLGAEELALAVVEEGLCACVNVVPGVRSFFRWQGRVDQAEERLLVAKTTAAAAGRLRQRLVELHPYDLPEVIEVAVADGLEAYLQWVADAVAPPPS